jgi:5-enolpyruvylshikimate-3-phosphate synthase
MTRKCLETFGISCKLDKKARKIFINAINKHIPHSISIENDLSTFSYPYVFYELHGFRNKTIESEKYMQGDVLFYEYVETLKKKLKSNQKVIKFDFNNCTDTFMTFMVFCCSYQVTHSGI